MDDSKILAYYQAKHPGDEITIQNVRNITSGWETEIISFDLVDRDDRLQKLVARIYPGSDAVEKAQSESSTMRKVREIGYPVPRVHIVETESTPVGNPFIIMDRIDGGTLDDKLQEDERRWAPVFLELFVRLHKLNWRELSPPDKILRFDDSFYYIKTTLSYIESALRRIGKHEFLPVVEWARNGMTDVPCKEPSITHGDYHPMNILVDENEKPFVIDWGAARVADFRSDLAWTLLLVYAYDTRERRNMILRGYETVLGQKVEQIEYFEGLASLRRLVDVTAAFDGQGNLHPGALEMMKETAGHIVRVRDRLRDLTGITIPQIEEFLEKLTE